MNFSHGRSWRPARLLLRPVDNASLAVFRAAFGVLVCWNLLEFCANGLIAPSYVTPQFHFTYYGFDWVRPWPGALMYAHVYGLIVVAALVALGLFYRVAAWTLFLGYSYLFLLEKSFYLNHEYLICLLALLMACVPAHRRWSVDALMRPDLANRETPLWTVWLLRFQIGLPYVFGGIAKLDNDWLHKVPVRLGLSERVQWPVIGPYLAEEGVISAVTYGGLVFDLAVVPLLLWRRTRMTAFLVAVLFHVTNAILFNIGIFPWLMIAGTILFFDYGWPLRVLRRSDQTTSAPGEPAVPERMTVRQRLGLACLSAYALVQLAVPLRHHLYPGNPSWTEEGDRFAWRMMLVHKQAAVQMIALDPVTQQSVPVDVRGLLTRWQFRHFTEDPDMILQLSHFLAERLADSGFGNREVYAVAMVSLNGRKAQLLVDPYVDLARQRRTWSHAPWIVPLHEPLREEPWDVPVRQWLDQVVIDGRPASELLLLRESRK